MKIYNIAKLCFVIFLTAAVSFVGCGEKEHINTSNDQTNIRFQKEYERKIENIFNNKKREGFDFVDVTKSVKEEIYDMTKALNVDTSNDNKTSTKSEVDGQVILNARRYTNELRELHDLLEEVQKDIEVGFVNNRHNKL